MQNDGNVADIRTVVAELWKYRLLVITSIFVSTSISLGIALLTEPVYRATTVLAAVTGDHGIGSLSSSLGQLGGLASLAGVSIGGGGSATDEYIAVLQSRQFTEQFIADNLLLPKLFSDEWDSQSGRWKTTGGATPSLAKANKLFDSTIRRVSHDKKTGLVTLSIDWRDREEASRWANEIVRRLNEELRNRQITSSEAYVSYLEKELERTNVIPTREAINHLIEVQVKQKMLAKVSPEYAFRAIDKALPPDADDPVRPRKQLIAILGPFVGFAIGLVIVIALNLYRG